MEEIEIYRKPIFGIDTGRDHAAPHLFTTPNCVNPSSLASSVLSSAETRFASHAWLRLVLDLLTGLVRFAELSTWLELFTHRAEFLSCGAARAVRGGRAARGLPRARPGHLRPVVLTSQKCVSKTLRVGSSDKSRL